MENVNGAQPEQMLSWADTFFAYQIDFNCSHVARVRSGSKRLISWRFGFCQLDALQEGHVGEKALGKEHEVRLIWSVRSGKVELIWNGRKIQNFVSNVGGRSRAPSSVECSWKSKSGVVFRILAHSEQVREMSQYNLFIEGRSFFTLPFRNQVGMGDFKFDRMEFALKKMRYVSRERNEELRESHHVGEGDDDVNGRDRWNGPMNLDVPADFADHMSSSDISDDESFAGHDLDEDLRTPRNDQLNLGGDVLELRSDIFMSKLEALKDDLTCTFPEAESLMSRAIVNALSEEQDESVAPLEIGDGRMNPFEVEADSLRETFKFMKGNKEFETSEDSYDRKMTFLQSQLDLIVGYVRDEKIKSSAASTIIREVAAVLSLDISIQLPRTTAVLIGLPKKISRSELQYALEQYGNIAGVAIAKRKNDFGICRFSSSSGLLRLSESFRNGDFSLNGITPRVVELHSYVRRNAHEEQNYSDGESADHRSPREPVKEWRHAQKRTTSSPRKYSRNRHHQRQSNFSPSAATLKQICTADTTATASTACSSVDEHEMRNERGITMRVLE
mmetsp:Transcript_30910/g.47385  ORF Transcript_30910/g.47385 Transcript_30910/m.47385 type:complete len:560 (+) Transcript_30910:179-1858(+)|eukprot:CAMPEP_0118675610 /NCGR_PEP_ID=MMETSP0800-20121206/1554_1 /TAXON_ID=210618 ORGANISM="Striatella unipunctata, Strain CCMP2910" /NCGR_SAMPLE_ID=MMETSP0800 /ASSEMBLY_ACC=CAM_ASM_000638 /LENGTH=559 /DNA_ID=CAMNT_0006570965 /DNA_START=170 /DNA_END=1849 /DNA_ORIENTATION=+